MRGARAGALLALLAAVLYLPGLGRTDLWAPDEPNFAEVAREMIVDGHWALPHDNGEVFTDKPPLFFWLIALVSLVAGGVSSLTARLPSALAGIAAVLLTWRIGLRSLREERVAAAGAAAFAVSWMTFDKARSAQIDMVLCALILCALSCFLRAADGEGRIWGLGFWGAMALAVLAKGPVGLLLPLGSVVLFLALTRRLGVFRKLAPLAGPLLFAAVVGTWMIAAQRAGGPEGYSIVAAMNRHVFERFAEGLHHPKPPWYYLQALPRGILPWSAFLPAMIAAGAGSLRRPGANEPAGGGVFLISWFAFVFLFFSVSTEKRDLYVLPLYPAAGLLLALAVDQVVGRGQQEPEARGPSLLRSPAWIVVPAWATAALFLLAGGAALVLSEAAVRRLSPDRLAPLLDEWSGVYGPARSAVAVLLAGGAAAAVCLARGRSRGGVAALGAGAGACWLAVALVALPAFNPHKSSREFCERIDALAAPALAPGERVGLYRFYRSTFTFYSPGVRYQTLDSAKETLEFLGAPHARFLIALESDVESLPRPPGVVLDPLARGNVGHRVWVLLRTRPADSPAGPSEAVP